LLKCWGKKLLSRTKYHWY